MFAAVHLLLLCIRRCCLTVGGKSNGLRFVQRWQRGPAADRASGWPWTGEWPGQFGVCGLHLSWSHFLLDLLRILEAGTALPVENRNALAP